jgi:hypothetical protein
MQGWALAQPRFIGPLDRYPTLRVFFRVADSSLPPFRRNSSFYFFSSSSSSIHLGSI